MIPSLHMNTVRCTNLVSAFKIAHKVGYQGVEITVPQIRSYLEAGFQARDICSLLDTYALTPFCINDIFGVESIQTQERERVALEMEQLAVIASEIGCKQVQLCPLNELADLSWPEVARLTAKNIRLLADIANTHGIRIQMEGVAWTPINSLSREIEVLDRIERSNVGIAVDLWHYWAPGKTTPEEVSNIDKSIICNVHFCDGKRPLESAEWDELALRAYYPGEGDIPMREWMQAVKATGYIGACSAELYSSRHWQSDPNEVACTMFTCMEEYL